MQETYNVLIDYTGPTVTLDLWVNDPYRDLVGTITYVNTSGNQVTLDLSTVTIPESSSRNRVAYTITVPKNTTISGSVTSNRINDVSGSLAIRNYYGNVNDYWDNNKGSYIGGAYNSNWSAMSVTYTFSNVKATSNMMLYAAMTA